MRIIICIFAFLSVMFGGCADALASSNVPLEMRTTIPRRRVYERKITKINTKSAEIGATKAKEIALEHAGLKEINVAFFTSKQDYEDGYKIYDIEFYAGGTEYDYEIDAYTGHIRSYDYHIEKYSAQAVQKGGVSYISMDEAKNIALKKAGLTAGKVRYTETEFEYDDGVASYQIEFVSGRKEYEFEINAVTGAIIEYDVDYD